MSDCIKSCVPKTPQPQCQYFVIRKKRLCRMTVRPGRQYCGEHEPEPKLEDGQIDSRIPCPNDPKHTCYASKLEKHLSICNARQGPLQPYIQLNINVPGDIDQIPSPSVSLNEVPQETITLVIDKINKLYDKFLLGNIETIEQQEIHDAVLADFQESNRTEKSRRHLRQVSSLLHLAEREGLVQPNTCYVELGAGKGHLSYYLWRAWRAPGSGVLLIDRASLRHKRDNKLREHIVPHSHSPTDTDTDTEVERDLSLLCHASLRHKRDNKLREHIVPHSPTDTDTDTAAGSGEARQVGEAGEVGESVCRVRAALEHVAVGRTHAARSSKHLLGLAKHLCGAATDYALRSLVSDEAVSRTRGALVATCCHHRVVRAHLLGQHHLQEMGITCEELDVIVRIVSWATCGDGRSREGRARGGGGGGGGGERDHVTRAEVGRRGKALVDYARVLALRDHGFQARLCYFVPTTVSPENICIIASKPYTEAN